MEVMEIVEAAEATDYTALLESIELSVSHIAAFNALLAGFMFILLVFFFLKR